jgi:MFS family permease
VLALAIAHGFSYALFNGVDVYLAAEILQEGGRGEVAAGLGGGVSSVPIGGWRLSALLGSWLGPVIGALTLFQVGHIDATERYHTHGYSCVVLLGACYTVLALVLHKARFISRISAEPDHPELLDM